MRIFIFNVLLVLLAGVCYTNGHGNHGHGSASNTGSPTPPVKVNFHDPKITQDEAHLKEHLKDQIDVNRRMSPQEMEFHYFRLHDTNNDTKLDGLEIMAALSHMNVMFEVKPHEKVGKTEEQIAALQKDRHTGALNYYTDIIDRVLMEDDLNKDGYISYPEFVHARQRDYAMHQQQMQQQQFNSMQQQQQYQQWQQFQQWQQQQAQQGNQQNLQYQPGQQLQQPGQQFQQTGQQFQQTGQQFQQTGQQQGQPQQQIQGQIKS